MLRTLLARAPHRYWHARTLVVLALVASTLLVVAQVQPAKPLDGATASLLDSANFKMPLYFIKNEGQLDASVLYYTEGGDTRIYFKTDGVVFAQLENQKEPTDRGRWLSKLNFDNAHAVAPVGSHTEDMPKVNYFLGEQSNWKTKIETTTKIVYQGLWDGIDMIIEGDAGYLKYTFAIAPYADPNQINLSYDGADIALQDDGSLRVTTEFDSYVDTAPTALQHSPTEQPVSVAYAVKPGSSSYHFTVGQYDPAYQLLIDPAVLIWGTYLGSTGYDSADGMAIDATGLYATGYASSSIAQIDASTGYDQTHNGGANDGWIAKFSLDGTSMIWGTYLGGDGADGLHALDIDGSGNVYVTGDTRSDNFPTTGGAFDTSYADTSPGNDLFVTKLNAAGDGLIYSTYTGGDLDDIAYDLDVDDSGRAYVVGQTDSWASTQSGACGALVEYFPVIVGPDLTFNEAAPCPPIDEDDGFIGRLNADGSAWDFLGYVGGESDDFERADIVLDASGNAYISGRTSSTQATFPDGDGFGAIPGFDQTYNGGTQDGVVVKVTSAGVFSYASYLGGSGDDSAHALEYDGSGGVYLTGWTSSADFPTLTGPDLSQNGDYDAFLTHLNAAGTALISSGFIGGASTESFGNVRLDSDGNVTMCGSTTSDENDGIPLVDGPDLDQNDAAPAEDGYLIKMDASTFDVIHAGYIGGDAYDYCYQTVADVNDPTNIYFGMESQSSDTTFPNGYGWYSIDGINHTRAADSGNWDAVIGMLDIVPAAIPVTESGGSTDISELGPTSDDYTVVLTSRPTFNVTVTISPNAQQTTDEASLTFTPLNWDVPQTVTTTAVVDATQECNHTGLILHTATSQDLNYDGISVASVVPNITDYCPGVTVTESGGSTNLAECGLTDTYTVVLNTPPSDNVTITPNPDTQQTVAPTQLTFTPANWDTPQTITVTATPDKIPEGSHTGMIEHSASSADADYDGIAVADVITNIIEGCRITARDPVHLAIEVSKTRFRDGEAKAVLISREDLWIDAFVGTPLSTIADGPLLLNPTAALNSDVLAEINRVLPDQGGTIYLLGRERALADKVHEDLAAAGFTTIVRLGGINRNATAELIAEEVLDLNTTPVSSIFFSENERLVDAMTVSAAAAEVSDGSATPILLSVRGSAQLDGFARNFITHHPEITQATIVGGNEALPADIEDSIYAARPDLLLSRLFGENRYGTARAIADTYFTAPTGVVVAGGERHSIAGALSADAGVGLNGLVGALLAGGLAADYGQPLLISRPAELPPEIASYLTANASTIEVVTIVGNELDVSTAVANQILQLIE